MNIRRFVEILLVEDNPADIEITRLSLMRSNIHNNLNVVMDGAEAIQYLRKEGQFAEALRPDLVLLDLNLPKKGGHQVLGEIKQDKDLADIPVVVLSSSNAEMDIKKSYKLHANCYVRKPVDFDQFVNIISETKDFWFRVAKLPTTVSVR